MVHSSKLLPILFLRLYRRDSRLTVSQPLDSRLTVWHHSNVEILFCCVPTSPAIGATEMRSVVFDCFSDVSEFFGQLKQNASTSAHTNTILNSWGWQVPKSATAWKRTSVSWNVESSRLPNAKFQPRSLRIAALAQFGSKFLPSINHIIHHVSYPSIFPICPWGFFGTIKMIRMCLVSETFGYFIAWAVIECDCCDWTASSAEPIFFGRSECVLVIELMSFTKRTVSSPL